MQMHAVFNLICMMQIIRMYRHVTNICYKICISAGLTCYQCVNIADPSACKQVAACFPGEVINNNLLTLS